MKGGRGKKERVRDGEREGGREGERERGRGRERGMEREREREREQKEEVNKINTHVYCTRVPPHTSHISYLLRYPSLRLLVPGLSSQFLPYFPIQPAFKVTTSQ